ncbi:fibronectin type III domain-containing protein [Fulvivirga sp. 29W222]|uniref:Fibronectin type III domain-containing protein n=1 Tax=Fulvivirga marina TaxID=2494733 RepID=A0A937KG42_9BACT|nr:fibronectin type III domain-containing protein [Fulvivirga marina]MBL6448803.1 fibronectin type III domain-containing protein [Fulvivirga marina]
MNKRLLYFLLIGFAIALSSFSPIGLKSLSDFFLITSITTSGVSGISDTQASVGGETIVGVAVGETITGRGTYYSTSSGVDTTSTQVSYSTADEGTDFVHDLTSLASATKYFYRAYVMSDLVTVLGEERSFWTLSTEPDTHPGILEAVAISSTSISVSFSALDVLGGNGADGYILVRKSGGLPIDISSIEDGLAPADLSLTGITLLSDITDTFSNSFTDNVSLSPDTQYSYAIVPYKVGANNSTYNYLTGTDINSLSVRSVTETTPPDPPAKTTNVVASNIGSSSFTLTWDVMDGADSYDIDVATNAGFSTGLIQNTDIEGNTYDVPNLAHSTKYYFRVRAKNAGGVGDFSDRGEVTTSAPMQVYLATTEPDLVICSGDRVDFFAFGATTYEFKIGTTVVQSKSSVSTYSSVILQNGDDVSVTGYENSDLSSASSGGFTVYDAPEANIIDSSPSFFVEDDPVALEGYISYSGGVLSVSGTGVAKDADGYKFYPTIAGENNHEIIYTVESPEGCVRTVYQNIDVFSGALTLSGKYCSNLSSTTLTVKLERIPEGKIYQRLRFMYNGSEISNPAVYQSTSSDNIQYTFSPAEAFAAGIDTLQVELIVKSIDVCDSRHPSYPEQCDEIMNDSCHPDNPTYPNNCGCASCGVCDPDYDAGDPFDLNDQYPESCSTVMNNPCHPDNPSYPGSCTDCDTRNPNYPNSCDAVMNNPCHPDNPSYPGSCDDCDTRNPNYPYSCDNVMNNPCDPDNPSYPTGCDIGPDPCLRTDGTGRFIDCQLQRAEEARVTRIAEKSARIMEYNKLAFPQLFALASDEEIFQTKETNIIIPEIGEITSLNDFYCASSGDVQLEGTFSGNFSGAHVQEVNGQYFFQPSTVVIPAGESFVNETIVYSYFDNGGCSNSIETNVKVYELPPSPVVDDIVLCHGDTPENFFVQNPASGASVTWYSDAGLTIPVGSGTVFNPGVTTTGPSGITYYVTQGVNGCQSMAETVNILIYELSTGLVMHELSNATYCRDYEGQISLIAEPAPLPGSSAEFVLGNTVSQTYHTIPASLSGDALYGVASFSPADFDLGVYKIHYRFINENGCVSESATETVNFVDFEPTVSFGVSRIQEGEETLFKGDDLIIKNLSSGGHVLDSVFWNFGGEAVVADGNNLDSIYRHQFSAAGVYDVTYSILTESFCSGQITKKVGIFPAIEVSDDNYYIESFEQTGHGWIESEKLELGNASSWALTMPQGDTIKGAASGVNSWITNAGVDASGNPNNSYNKSEDSWIEGPCFYINNLSRPVLSLKIWSDTEDGFDGAVVEYSIGDTTEWNTLGSIEEGLEWYNTQGLVGAPGNQSGASFGWSGKLHGDWTLAKFPLDDIRVKAGNRPVRFRVAFASTSDNPFGKTFDGFAFDDFTIESRNRVVLLEHFTNLSSSESKSEDSKLRSFVEGKSPEVIDIQYHTSFPGADPLNQFNKADPSARALHYAIAEVPRTVMDGVYGVYYKNEPFFRDSWGVNAYNTRALISAPFNIDISLGDDVATTLEITANISKNATAEIIEGNLIVQLAVVERQVTIDGNTYYNVVRRLLPNAAGNRLFGDWQPEDTRVEQVVQTWNPSIEPGNSEFMVVASIYNEKSKEVYQAAHMSIPASKMPPMAKVTGVDDPLSKGGVSLFPNPTEKEINILFPAPLNEEYVLTVYDIHGVEVHRGVVRRGAVKATLDTEAYSSGVYSVRLNSGTDQVIRRFIKK